MFKTKLFGPFSSKPPAVETPLIAIPKLFYIKACNGAGKSTIPSLMAERDPDAYYLTIGKRKYATVFPSYRMISLGKYDNSNSKGCDSLKDTEMIMNSLEYVERNEHYNGYSIIVEGIIPATIKETWVERLQGHSRPLVITFLDTPFETCLERISARNSNKSLDGDLIELVRTKYNRIQKHKEDYKELFPEIKQVTINATCDLDTMINKFLTEDYL